MWDCLQLTSVHPIPAGVARALPRAWRRRKLAKVFTTIFHLISSLSWPRGTLPVRLMLPFLTLVLRKRRNEVPKIVGIVYAKASFKTHVVLVLTKSLQFKMLITSLLHLPMIQSDGRWSMVCLPISVLDRYWSTRRRKRPLIRKMQIQLEPRSHPK